MHRVAHTYEYTVRFKNGVGMAINVIEKQVDKL